MTNPLSLLLCVLSQAQSSPREWKYTVPEHEPYNAIRSIVEIGDVDGDGVIDVVIGSQKLDDRRGGIPSWYDTRGSVTCVSGATARGLWRDDGPRCSECPNEFGEVLAPLADIDGDGIRDLAIGIPYVPQSFEGDPFATGPLRSTVRILSGKNGHTVREHHGIEDGVDGFGMSLAGSCDIDGDGVADYAVGACTAGLYCMRTPESDSISIFSGKTGDLITKLVASSFAAGETFGRTLLDAGDLDGDGVSELAVKIDSAVDFGGTWCAISVKERRKLFAIDERIGRIGSDLLEIGDRTGDGVGDFAVLVVECASATRKLLVAMISGKDGAVVKRVDLDVPGNTPLLEDHALSRAVWRLVLTRGQPGGMPTLSVLSWSPSHWFRIAEDWSAHSFPALSIDGDHALIGHSGGGTSVLTAAESFYTCLESKEGRITIVKRVRP